MNLTKQAKTTAIVLAVTLTLGLWIAGNYNSLVTGKNSVDNSWSKVETQYQRRFDLIDNLVASVKGAQGQEKTVFEAIANARTAYASASNANSKASAASTLESNVALVPRLQEAYPDLKSNTQVQSLMTQLTSTENDIAGVRNTYNDTATNYNNNVARFPKNIFAGMFNFQKQTLFKADANASTAPKVTL